MLVAISLWNSSGWSFDELWLQGHCDLDVLLQFDCHLRQRFEVALPPAAIEDLL
jgi:hypothetical protein